MLKPRRCLVMSAGLLAFLYAAASLARSVAKGPSARPPYAPPLALREANLVDISAA